MLQIKTLEGELDLLIRCDLKVPGLTMKNNTGEVLGKLHNNFMHCLPCLGSEDKERDSLETGSLPGLLIIKRETITMRKRRNRDWN